MDKAKLFGTGVGLLVQAAILHSWGVAGLMCGIVTGCLFLGLFVAAALLAE